MSIRFYWLGDVQFFFTLFYWVAGTWLAPCLTLLKSWGGRYVLFWLVFGWNRIGIIKKFLFLLGHPSPDRSLPMASLWILLSFLLPWSISAFNKSYLLKGRDSFIFIEQDVQCHVHRHLMNICSIGGLNALFHIWNMEVLPLLIQVSFIVNRVLRNIFCSSFSYLKWSNRHILWYMLG